MSTANEPIMKLDPSGSAPILSYNVPEPTSYPGTNIIELNLSALGDVFKEKVAAEPLFDHKTYTYQQVQDNMVQGFTDKKLFVFAQLNKGGLVYSPSTEFFPTTPTSPDIKLSDQLRSLRSYNVWEQLQQGMLLNVYTDIYGALTYNWVPIPLIGDLQRILLVERYRLSSFLGTYGAGRTIKTFTLLPGEKTKISIKTYSRKETSIKNASSILDSFDQSSAQDFESSVQTEQSDKRSSSENMSYYVDAEASFNWGWGSASVKAGVKGGTNSSREEFAKNLHNATQKHSSKASAKRDVQVNSSSEVKEESGDESVTEREIQNINVSRTLNFVFRQMNQEFITLLHLVDVRLAYWTGNPKEKEEFTLPRLPALLERYVKEEFREKVEEAIVGELSYVFDYMDEPHSFIEKRVLLKDPSRPASEEGNVLTSYYRVPKGKTMKYTEPENNLSIEVPGVILFADKNVMRTDGVIVDALLGAGDGLDAYSHGLQDEAVREKALSNRLREFQVKREELAQRLVADQLADQAKIFTSCFVPAVSANGTQEEK